MKEKDFLYSISFASSDFKIKEEETELSTASLEKLKKVIPDFIKEKDLMDLMPVSFNLATVNSFNRKGEGISSSTAVSILKSFANRPTNIEHENKEIVGHIISACFTDLDNERILSEEEALSTDEPFYITLSAFVYKIIFPGFANLLRESSNPESSMYKKVSASWELGFNKYDIAIGSSKLNECFVISKNDNRFPEYNKMLRKNKGNGKDRNNIDVNLLVVGKVFPLGVGFTTNPAGHVEGIYVEEEIGEETNEIKEQNAASQISHNEQNDVTILNKTNKKDMDENDIKNLIEKTLENKMKKEEFSQETIASMTSFITEKIKERDKEYKEEKQKLEQEKLEASKLAEERDATLKEVQKNLETAQEEIATLKASIQEREKQDVYNFRMNYLDEQFDFSEEDRKIVASDLKALDVSEEAFASYKEKTNVIFKEKSKAYKKTKDEEMKKKIDAEVEKRMKEKGGEKEMDKCKASNDSEENKEGVEDAIDNLKASDDNKDISNNNGDSTQEKKSLVDSLKDNFKKNIKVQY